ncbi:4-coumarate--CoA ligase 2-like [Argonauta hians]
MLFTAIRPTLVTLSPKVSSKWGVTQKYQRNASWLLNHCKFKIASSLPSSQIGALSRPLSTTCHIRQSEKGIIKSRHEPFPIPDNMNLTEFALSAMEQYKSNLLIQNGITGVNYTYGEVINKTFKVASALKKSGYQPGDVIAVFSANNPEYLIAFMAASAIGLTTTTVNSGYSAKELQFHLENSNSCAIITVPEMVTVVKEAMATSKTIKLKEIIVFGNSHGCRPFSTLMEDDGTAFTEIYPSNPKEDILVLPYSSGTTGLPKGVMLTHHNIISNLTQLKVIQFTPSDRVLGILPFFHIYGMVCIMFSIALSGASIYTLPKFEPESFMSLLSKERLTCAHLVPPLILFLAKHPMVNNYDLSALKILFSGAAPLGKELIDECQEKIKFDDLVQGYGLTETSPATHLTVPPVLKNGSVGNLLPDTAAKIIDPETHEILGPMQTGELCVRGPQVMKGYLNRIDATAEMIKGDWLHTGDLAHYDEEEYFYITDRLKELIKYKGFQVPPAELEALLITHPNVQDSAVIGVPDVEAGEIPRAFVVLKDTSITKEQDIIDFVKDNVAPHKKLRGGVQFVSEIPKSAAGKILRRVLKDSLVKK